jgi:curved DNA-binding protein CbpA
MKMNHSSSSSSSIKDTLYVLSFILLQAVADGFIVTKSSPSSIFPSTQQQQPQQMPLLPHTGVTAGNFNFALYSTKDTPPPLPKTEDPYLILGLSAPTADKKAIKRAYRRMALKYHPDVRTNANSTEQEKKIANDDFAKINGAYAILTGKDQDSSPNTSSGSGSGASGSNKYSYTPPHRRRSQPGSTNTNVDWEDFMPKYDDDQYDAKGDSFGAIFSDLFAEVGSAAVGGGSSSGILNDFVSFLEGNFPSMGTNTKTQNEEDIILNSLLSEGTFEDIKLELDDAKLLVKQLEGKQRNLMNEVEDLNRKNGSQTGTYMEQMRAEERRKEIDAQKDIVEDYLDRAKVRQMRLRRRYDEMKMDNFSTSNNNSAKNSNDRTSYGGYNTEEPSGGSRSNTSSSKNSNDDNDNDDAWKREGFGSSGRRRGRGRSRTSSTGGPSPSSSSSSTSANSYNSSRKQQSSNYESNSSSRTGGSSSSSSSTRSRPYDSSSRATSTPNDRRSVLPPHRRVTSRFERNLEDKRRLREIKVDEEIDQLKKELGL